jgi:hypothetical protein
VVDVRGHRRGAGGARALRARPRRCASRPTSPPPRSASTIAAVGATPVDVQVAPGVHRYRVAAATYVTEEGTSRRAPARAAFLRVHLAPGAPAARLAPRVVRGRAPR